ncbi:hypothetical protein SPRG_16602 [Saprolegnia parasitica CBS 223.65]|uniref:Uncharacterized protein n=1 Tax=Saprolegnia parasitica (strain CBS 223.65) TaxID=695850 RepID=A0A067BTN9_SAPPC|nr:hypothetical protein SPRG_16602 [Saprolegnia parasitica CBS 223.65]KDO18017.1 hypothetical protein SPRG_16602 [Saprolegnia parasitica CBS 223.65]|eukprot:XP_012211275.1 hypothetical protein SPRG_16602 [Saprolegnia parasitica CBS 223.65]
MLQVGQAHVSTQHAIRRAQVHALLIVTHGYEILAKGNLRDRELDEATGQPIQFGEGTLTCLPVQAQQAPSLEGNLLNRASAYTDDSLDLICYDDATMTAIKAAASSVFRSTQVDAPMYAASLAWFTTKKLGSLLDDAAHLHARERLTTSGLHNMLLVLLNNCGMLALTPTSLAGLDSFHRQRCNSIPRSEIIVRQQRRLVGHVLA